MYRPQSVKPIYVLTPDPRLKVLHDRMNEISAKVNALKAAIEEKELQLAKVKATSADALSKLEAKVGGDNIKAAEPYYKLVKEIATVREEVERAASEEERLTERYQLLKNSISIADQRNLDPSEEMSRRAVSADAAVKLSETEVAVVAARRDHRLAAERYQRFEEHMEDVRKQYQRKLPRVEIYFETKETYAKEIEALTARIDELRQNITHERLCYDDLEKKTLEILPERVSFYDRD